jgi:hypothetical protein
MYKYPCDNHYHTIRDHKRVIFVFTVVGYFILVDWYIFFKCGMNIMPLAIIPHLCCKLCVTDSDRLCGLVIRVSGYGTQRSIYKFDSGCYQIFWEVVSLERGPLSLVSTVKEVLEIKSRGSGLEIREYCRRDLSRWPRGTFYQKEYALTSPTSGCRSVGIVRSWTQATIFFNL